METRKTKKSRRKYDSEFKEEVLKMVESGRGVPEIADSLGIGSGLIYQWVRRSKASSGQSSASSIEGSSFNEEKASLYKKIEELETERDILKKALGIFSRTT